MSKKLYKGFVIVLIISVIPVVLNMIRYYAFGVWKGVCEPTANYFVVGALFSLITSGTLFSGCAMIIEKLNIKVPWKRSVKKRLFIEIALIFFFTSISQIIIIYGFSFTSFFNNIELNAAVYYDNILFGNTLALIVIAIIEGSYFFNQWKMSLIVAEKMKSESLKGQVSSLKSQLDPHFLFNSLNVLSSLIRKDTDKAELFVDDFAKVYRYVLEVKNEMVVTLRSEIEFLDAYINLQKIRFGEGLHIQIDIPSQSLNLYVPPLSLQELVNNAIKHNAVSEEDPLIIKIQEEEGYLTVKNNLQLRHEEINSTGLGLENLEKRYSLLNDRLPHFRMINHTFMAKIPLLEVD